MQLTAIVMARILAFVEVQELNPQGKAYYPDIVSALVQRFNFQVFPTKPEEYNEETGILFTDGKFSEGSLERVQIFTHGILLDTRIDTDVSDKLLHDTLTWARSELGLRYEENMIKRKAFVSQVTFESEMNFNKLNPVLGNISNLITSKLRGSMGQTLNYEPTGVILNLDQTASKIAPGPFTVERRVELPFTDKKYFSAAPLSTKDHLAALKEFEKVLL
ncbi:MAG: hypothetical protein DMG96_26275 [Acidobacteria bacterium]|nr:MAG: hypothetical protein DMG96_26275 [Acidobacteriota bacterium]